MLKAIDSGRILDSQKFIEACKNIIQIERGQNGTGDSPRSIGTLGEKTLHAVLKQYYEPDRANHERKIGSFVADIVNDAGIIEIQTRAFDKLRKKLAGFLEIYPVTVIYPIPKTKWLLWIDTQTGEITKKRKSPKQGRIFDAIFELYKIKSLLCHSNFRLRIVFLDMEEYRYLNGWSKDKKKGSTRCDRMPVGISEEIQINNTLDYVKFIPDELPVRFTSKDYKSAAHTTLRTAQTALNILSYTGIIGRVEKHGNLCVYEKTSGAPHVTKGEK